MQGKFITFEGPDGSGKSTNIPVLVEYLRSQGYKVVTTREPGGTVVGEKIRDILLHDYMHPSAELLLFAAQRAEHIKSLIQPALEAGNIVICDRFYDSTFAYQGARGYAEDVLELEDYVQRGFKPDYTLFFDVTLEESLNRIRARTKATNVELDRFEAELNDYRARVYDGYQQRFKMYPDRMVRIDSMQVPQNVAAQVIDWASKVFK